MAEGASVGTATRDVEPEDDGRDLVQTLVSSWLDIILSILAIVLAAIIVVEFTVDLSEGWSRRLYIANLAIWAIFVAAFLFELSLAESKTRFLKKNWIAVLALAVPMLRVLRIFAALRILRTARAARSLSIIRASTTVNSVARTVGDFLRISQFAYALMLTALVTFIGAALAYFIERDANSGIDSFGDALWWSATIITTINSPLEPVTLEGRIVGILLRIFGVTVIGYITARLAVYFLGKERREATPPREELRAIRDELAAIRERLERTN
jgi:voltage-gated potassium channel